MLSSGRANDRVGWLLAVVFVGISYSWWMDRHTRHHANPNQVGKDPDIGVDTISSIGAWGIVLGYLNRVGLAARPAFACPTSATLRQSHRAADPTVACAT